MERRKNRRFPQRLYLTIDELPGRNIAFTSDISSDGMSIEAHAPLRVGRIVSVMLSLPSGKNLFLTATVKRVARNPVNTGAMSLYQIGLALQKVPEEFRRFITSLTIAQQQQQSSSSPAMTPTPEPPPGLATPDESVAPAASASPPEPAPPIVEPTPAQSDSKSDAELPDPQPIIVAYEAMKQQNHYEVLGLESKASRAQIKHAYYVLSKTYHPEGPLGECSKELKHNLEELFHRIAEAFVTLSSDEQRKRYDRELAAQQSELSQTTLTKRFRSNQHVQQGLRELKAGQFEAAAASFDLAVTARPEKWKYHTLLAFSLSKLPGRERDAEAHYREAIKLEPSRAENYIGLGRLFRRTGQASEALHAFEDALQWDAENTRIIKEIDAIKKVA